MDDLQVILEAHNKAIMEYVAGITSGGAAAAAATAEDEEESDWAKEKASLLKRNTELAGILGLRQKTVSEQEVHYNCFLVLSENG